MVYGIVDVNLQRKNCGLSKITPRAVHAWSLDAVFLDLALFCLTNFVTHPTLFFVLSA